MTDPTISYFNNIAHTKKGMSLTFSDFLEKIKDGFWQDQVLKYRNQKTQESKKALPLLLIVEAVLKLLIITIEKINTKII